MAASVPIKLLETSFRPALDELRSPFLWHLSFLCAVCKQQIVPTGSTSRITVRSISNKTPDDFETSIFCACIINASVVHGAKSNWLSKQASNKPEFAGKLQERVVVTCTCGARLGFQHLVQGSPTTLDPEPEIIAFPRVYKLIYSKGTDQVLELVDPSAWVAIQSSVPDPKRREMVVKQDVEKAVTLSRIPAVAKATGSSGDRFVMKVNESCLRSSASDGTPTVARALRTDESISTGITARAVGSTVTPMQHVLGMRDTPFISTTQDAAVVIFHALPRALFTDSATVIAGAGLDHMGIETIKELPVDPTCSEEDAARTLMRFSKAKEILIRDEVDHTLLSSVRFRVDNLVIESAGGADSPFPKDAATFQRLEVISSPTTFGVQWNCTILKALSGATFVCIPGQFYFVPEQARRTSDFDSISKHLATQLSHVVTVAGADRPGLAARLCLYSLNCSMWMERKIRGFPLPDSVEMPVVLLWVPHADCTTPQVTEELLWIYEVKRTFKPVA
jgi:hypothetical protein